MGVKITYIFESENKKTKCLLMLINPDAKEPIYWN